MIEIKKEFAPINIHIKTEAELQIFIGSLRRAVCALRSLKQHWSYAQCQDAEFFTGIIERID